MNVNQALKSFGSDEKRIHGYQCDVTQKQQRVELLKRIEEMYGRLDVLILNQAVISHIGKQMEITEAKFD
jgi:NAD(P)-dependent dehydrogenase (short-subunit alcohol dehydrogenase family)